jgi:hypothetical protein
MPPFDKCPKRYRTARSMMCVLSGLAEEILFIVHGVKIIGSIGTASK